MGSTEVYKGLHGYKWVTQHIKLGFLGHMCLTHLRTVPIYLLQTFSTCKKKAIWAHEAYELKKEKRRTT